MSAPGYVFLYTEPPAFAGEPSGMNYARSWNAPRLDYFGVGYEDYERVVSVEMGDVYAIEADVDTAAVAETVTDSGYAGAGSYRDYDLFSRSDLRRVLAVRADALLFGVGERAGADVRAMADARAGGLARFHERDAVHAALTRRTGSRPWLYYGFGGFLRGDITRHVDGQTTGISVDDDHVYTYYTYLFDDAAVVDRAAIRTQLRDWVAREERPGPFGPDTTTADIDVDGRFVAVENRHPRGEFLDDGATTPMPQITWGFEDGDGRLTVRHEAGDSADASALFFRLRPPDRRQETSATLDDPVQFADEYDTVGPGDSVTLDTSGLPTGTDLQMVYSFEDRSARVFRYEVTP
ncbi:MAG: hypothetical protein ABEJ40_09240 [Haloarculaceae archaeon]